MGVDTLGSRRSRVRRGCTRDDREQCDFDGLGSSSCAPWCPRSASAQVREPALQDEAVAWLQSYLRVDTINPPGNEAAGVQFFKTILDRRGNSLRHGRIGAWTRQHLGAARGRHQPALMLLHHMDVVPANKASWRTDPLSGEIKDGYVFGRGALDTKSSGILHLAAFVALHRSKTALNRDVIFLATADEEAGGFFGVGWLVKNRPELFKGVGYVINEGGEGRVQGGRTQFGIEVTQKVPYWLHLTARGEPGHGSTPRPASSVTTLIAALERLRQHQFEAAHRPRGRRLLQGHRAGRRASGASASRTSRPRSGHPAWWRNSSATIRRCTPWSGTPARLPGLAAARKSMSCRRRPGRRSTVVCCQIRTRAVPGRTRACPRRGHPGRDHHGVHTAVSSADTELYRALEAVCRQHFPEPRSCPSVLGGFTDSHFLRDLGITAYGFVRSSFRSRMREASTATTSASRSENMRRGVTMMLEIARRVAAK